MPFSRINPDSTPAHSGNGSVHSRLPTTPMLPRRGIPTATAHRATTRSATPNELKTNKASNNVYHSYNSYGRSSRWLSSKRTLPQPVRSATRSPSAIRGGGGGGAMMSKSDHSGKDKMATTVVGKTGSLTRSTEERRSRFSTNSLLRNSNWRKMNSSQDENRDSNTVRIFRK